MKTMKKLGAIMLVMAMCLMLSTVVSADSVSLPEVACSATSDKANYCVSADTQQITVTVAPSVPTDMISLYANVLVPEGWSINSIQNAKLEEATNLPFADGYDSTTKQIQWFALKEVGGQLDIANCQTDVLAVITYNVPANAEGTFPLGLTDVEIYTDASGESNKFEFQEVKVNGNTELNVTIGEHDWEVTYTDTEGDTHTANYVCKNDASHTKSDEPAPHNFDNGDCVCGAKAPAQNDVTVVYKGDALANAYTVDGQVVTVEFDKACKVGYWDETAGKYIAIAADKISDNEYEFTAPEGVTEVLLVVKGDVTLDGRMNAGDKMALAKSLLPANNSLKTPLSDVQTFAADVNTMVGVNAGDKMTLAKALLPANNSLKTDLTW